MEPASKKRRCGDREEVFDIEGLVSPGSPMSDQLDEISGHLQTLVRHFTTPQPPSPAPFHGPGQVDPSSFDRPSW